MSRILKKQSKDNDKDTCNLKVICTGVGWQVKNSACNKTLIVNSNDIRRRYQSDKKKYVYGIICPACGCFTIISKYKFPGSIKENTESSISIAL